MRSFWFWKRSPEPLLGSFLDVQRYPQNPNSQVVSGIFASFSRALEPWAVQNIQKGKKVVECKSLEKHRCKLAGPRKGTWSTMPFAAAAGACVWGPNCQVPLTHGHLCTRCKLPAHTACTFENVMAFATRHRGTGAHACDVCKPADAPSCPR